MGGEDWLEQPLVQQRFEQIQQVQRAYESHQQPTIEPEPLESQNGAIAEVRASVEIPEPDWGDHVYVYLREKMSGDIIMGLFALGLIAIAWVRWNKKLKAWIKEWLRSKVQ